MKSIAPGTRPGRPRSFSEGEALDQALRVFWTRGYEGASLEELTAAMKINRPSLYAAFGNKEALFRRVLARYRSEASGFVEKALGEPTAEGVAETYLRGMVAHLSNRTRPRGCLLVHGALACGSSGEGIRRELIFARRSATQALRRRFLCAEKTGELPPDVRAGDLAHYLATVANGLSVQAVNGAGRRALEQVARIALRAWPSRNGVAPNLKSPRPFLKKRKCKKL